MSKIAAKIKKRIDALHGKTNVELATDHEVHPNSLLYRFCGWIGKKTGTIILTPFLYAVGTCAEEVYFGLLKARREGRKLVVLWPYELPGRLRFRLTNVEVINVESQYRAIPHDSWLTIAGRTLITVYFGFFRGLSFVRRVLLGTHLNNVHTIPAIGSGTLWQPENVQEFSWDVVSEYDWHSQLATRLEVHLGKSKQVIAEHKKRLLGLPDDAWFVCLHVRESGFHKDQCADRNANILNYVEAIREITGRGGWVVRMGDASMTRLPVMERVIDYPFSGVKCELMDVYLISQCRFYVGMISGIFDVARLFQRPLILTNMYDWLWGFPVLKGDLGIMKHVYSRRRGRFLTLREWLAEPWQTASFVGTSSDYLLYENTPEELRLVVQEYLDRDENWLPTAAQRDFNEARVKRGRELVSKQMFTADELIPCQKKQAREFDILFRYRFASRMEASVGMLGADFVQKNLDGVDAEVRGLLEESVDAAISEA